MNKYLVEKVEHDYTHENKNIIRIDLNRLHVVPKLLSYSYFWVLQTY